MDPPEDGPGRVAPSVDVTSAGTPAGGAGTGVGRFRVGPGPSSDSPPEPRIDASVHLQLDVRLAELVQPRRHPVHVGTEGLLQPIELLARPFLFGLR